MTPQKEDYLKAIVELGGDKELVNNKLIGKALSVSAASVTEMSSKLLKEGFISHIPYQGVKVTEKGLLIANQVIRKHRLWEVFLAEQLGFSWDKVHEIAEKLEHVSSGELIDRLDQYLGFPKTDPHGGMIPDREGNIPDVDSYQLFELKIGQNFTILEVDDETDFLQYLSAKGIHLEKVYTIKKVESFEGPISFYDENNNEYQISFKAASKLTVNKY